ncbi:hypothetical protein KKH82_02755 [Patescibacteria group bacterium]|nr:hypothetical protein [Patescibacteria group bacterium]
MKIYVDGRPINDKIIKRALMDAYAKHIAHGEYPFVVLMLNTQPGVVDANIHPSKSEVKFLDSQKIYQLVNDSVKQAL